MNSAGSILVEYKETVCNRNDVLYTRLTITDYMIYCSLYVVNVYLMISIRLFMIIFGPL